MRIALPLLAACAVIGACSETPRQVQSGPPSVSYQMTGDDVAQANIQAQNFCQHYGRAAQFQGLRATSTGNTAVYTCDGAVLGPTRSPTSSAPSALSGSSAVTPAPPPPPAAASGPPKSLTTAPTQ